MMFIIVESIVKPNSYFLSSMTLALPLSWLVMHEKLRKSTIPKKRKSLIQFFLIFGSMLTIGGIGVSATDKEGVSNTIEVFKNNSKILSLTLIALGLLFVAIGLSIWFLEKKKQKKTPPQ